MYQFAVQKVKCRLSTLWFIRFLFGWRRCDPQFSQYYNDWKQSVVNEIDKERFRIQKQSVKIKSITPEDIGEKIVKITFLTSAYNWLMDMWEKLKAILESIYKFTIYDPLRYLQSLLGEKQYPVQSFKEFNNKIRKMMGKPFHSMTKNGKVCKCKPSQTPYTKNLEKVNEFVDKLKDMPSAVKNSNVIKNIEEKRKNFDFQFDVSCQSLDRNIGTKLPQVIFYSSAGILALIAFAFIAQKYFFLPYKFYHFIQPFMKMNAMGQMSYSYGSLIIVIIILALLSGFSYYFMKE
jgi:hypothetical protein